MTMPKIHITRTKWPAICTLCDGRISPSVEFVSARLHAICVECAEEIDYALRGNGWLPQPVRVRSSSDE